MKKTFIAPSILSADFARMGEEVKNITEGKADLIHFDVMDGVFVPNITFGPKMAKDIKSYTNIPLDVHLMIIHPEKYIEEFAKAGADYITFHIESEADAEDTLKKIKSLGIKSGIVISPDTEVTEIENVLQYCDMVLVMSVYPGFGGQKFIESSLSKVKKLVALRNQNNYSYLIEIDGGINEDTIQKAKKVGVDVFVAGSAVFGKEDRKEAIEKLKLL